MHFALFFNMKSISGLKMSPMRRIKRFRLFKCDLKRSLGRHVFLASRAGPRAKRVGAHKPVRRGARAWAGSGGVEVKGN